MRRGSRGPRGMRPFCRCSFSTATGMSRRSTRRLCTPRTWRAHRQYELQHRRLGGRSGVHRRHAVHVRPRRAAFHFRRQQQRVQPAAAVVRADDAHCQHDVDGHEEQLQQFWYGRRSLGAGEFDPFDALEQHVRHVFGDEHVDAGGGGGRGVDLVGSSRVDGRPGGPSCLATATNIDGLNPAYAGLLGSGRVNAQAALTTTLARRASAAWAGCPPTGNRRRSSTSRASRSPSTR